MTKPTLLYYDILRFQPAVMEFLDEHFAVVKLPSPDDDTDAVLQSVEICLAPLGYPFDQAKIDKCPQLKLIASSTLSVPHIDEDYCRTKQIRVIHLGTETEFMNTITPTAELTWGLIIAITRKLPWAHQAVCAGQWEGRKFGRQTPQMLSKLRLGIVGLGRLGRLVAAAGEALVDSIYYYSPNTAAKQYQRCESPTELASAVDIVSIHAHHTAETEKMIDARFFQAMRPGSYLINTARGAIVDEAALLAALESGHLGGAALDVLADEYQAGFPDSLTDIPLVQYAREHDNLIITPHYAGATVDAWIETQMKTAELILANY